MIISLKRGVGGSSSMQSGANTNPENHPNIIHESSRTLLQSLAKRLRGPARGMCPARGPPRGPPAHNSYGLVFFQKKKSRAKRKRQRAREKERKESFRNKTGSETNTHMTDDGGSDDGLVAPCLSALALHLPLGRMALHIFECTRRCAQALIHFCECSTLWHPVFLPLSYTSP